MAPPPEPSSVVTDQRLRCVHYLDSIREESGGVVRAALDLVDGLWAAGVEVTVLTTDPSDAPAAWLEGRAGAPRVVTLKSALPPILRMMRLGSADRPLVNEAFSNADVLHLHTVWDPYNAALAHEAKRRGLPYVISAHGMLDDWCMSQKATKKRLYLRLVGRRMLRNAHAVHCTAEAEAEQALRHAPGSASRVTPLLLDLTPFTKPSTSERRTAQIPYVLNLEPYTNPPGSEIAREKFPCLRLEAPKLLFLSRVHYKKGVERLIKAAANLHDSGRPVETLIAGPGEPAYIERLKQLAAGFGIAEHVHFLGMVRDKLKVSLYEACDLFVLPTSQENFGIVLAEAVACGLPTVTTNGVDIARELRRCGAVIVGDKATPDESELTEAIRGLLVDPPGDEMIANGRTELLAWLNAQRVIQQYITLYSEAAAAARQAHATA